jgi:hypothetical protein
VNVDKLSISFDPEHGDAVRSADALAEFLAGWEAENGALTATEIARAERELSLSKAGDAAPTGPSSLLTKLTKLTAD